MTGWLVPFLLPGLSAAALVALLGYRAASGLFELVRRARLAWFRHHRSEVPCAADRTAPPPCSP